MPPVALDEPRVNAEPLVWVPPPTSVTLARHAFRTSTIEIEMAGGSTIAEIIAACGLPPDLPLRVWIDDWEIAPAYWRTTRPRPGRRVLVRAVAGQSGGGNKGLRIALMVVIAIVAIVIAVYAPQLIIAAGAAYGITVSAGAASAIALGASAAFSIGATLAVNALLPPPKPKLRDTTASGAASQTYTLTGSRNQFAPYQAVPRAYGRHRMFPPLAAFPTTFSAATEQSLTQLFTCGYGPLLIEDIRIGDTPIGEYTGAEVEIRGGWPDDPPSTLYPFSQYEEPLAYDLTPVNAHFEKIITHSTRPGTDAASVEFTFPRGLFRLDDKNTTLPMSLLIVISYRPVGSTAEWVTAREWLFTEARSATLRWSWAFNFPYRGQWSLLIGADVPPGWLPVENPPNPIVIYDVAWTALRSWTYETAAPLANMAKIAVRLTASGQLSGVVDQLNCIVSSYLWVYHRAENEWRFEISRNPAWIFFNILAGTATARPVPAESIDYGAIVAWAEDCDVKGYTFDAVFDTQSTVFESLQLVAAVGRAAFTLRDGLYSVVRDIPQTVAVQQFTPRNSYGFRATKTFMDLPHGLKVKFINPAANWQQDERLVFDDGYDAGNATKYDGIELFGITNPDLAWRHGRYWLAAAKLRPETYSLGVDVEHLIANRGDLVHVQHDVTLWGYTSGRIASVVRDGGGAPIGFTLDECLDDVPPATTLASRIRTADAQSHLLDVGCWARPETRDTLLAFAGPMPTLPLDVGDLVSLGQHDNATVACIVSKIEPGPDLTARLTLVDAAPEIQNADGGPIPPFDAHISHRPTTNNPPPLAPVIDAVASDQLSMSQLPGGAWVLAIRVACHALFRSDRLTPTLLELHYRPVDSPDGPWTPLPTQPASQAIANFYIAPVIEGQAYDIRVRAVSATTAVVASPWTQTRHTVSGETTPPPDPYGLVLDAQGLHLRWSYPTPPGDFLGFLVRYHQGAATNFESAQPLHDGYVSDTRFGLPPITTGTYTFYVKAVDQAGNQSIHAAVLTTPVNGISPGGATSRTLDFGPAPNWPGTKTALVILTAPSRISTTSAADPLFWTSNPAPFWHTGTTLFWGASHGPGSYLVGFDVSGADAGSTISLDWLGTGAWTIEYRVGAGGAWRAWPGQIIVSTGHYDVRWSTPAEATMTKCLVLFNVTQISEAINNVAIASGGTRLVLVRTYRQIINVQVTPILAAGDPVKIADVVDKSTAGPLVRLRLSDGSATAGVVDAIVAGF